MLKVLVACEESQAVCKAFRDLGHEAYSCDLQECSGGHPEWHIKGSVIPILGGGVTLQTEDRKQHTIPGLWDLIIAHPPCTYLTITGNRWFKDEYGTSAVGRYYDRMDAIRFFMTIALCSAKHMAIENPVGIMSSVYRKPDQIIQPWWFDEDGTEETEKGTCLWLKNLPQLTPRNVIKPDIKYHEMKSGKRQTEWYYQTRCLPHEERAKAASKTFKGIAGAMAEQWSRYIEKEEATCEI